MKAWHFMLILCILLVGCGPEYKDYVNKSTNQADFIERLVENNENLRSDKESLKEEVRELEDQLKASKRRNSALADRLEDVIKSMKAPPSPTGRIEQKDIRIFRDEVVISSDNLFAAVFEDTKSMEPVINSDSIALQIPVGESEAQIGDIIAFKAEEQVIVHRIIAQGQDGDGWFVITKGDNNQNADPWKVRKDDILGITVAVIY